MAFFYSSSNRYSDEINLNELDLIKQSEIKWNNLLEDFNKLNKVEVKENYSQMIDINQKNHCYILRQLVSEKEEKNTEENFDLLVDNLFENGEKKLREKYEKCGIIEQYAMRKNLEYLLKDEFLGKMESDSIYFICETFKNNGENLKKKYYELEPHQINKVYLFLRELIGKSTHFKNSYYDKIVVEDTSEKSFHELLDQCFSYEKKQRVYYFLKENIKLEVKSKIDFMLNIYDETTKNILNENHKVQIIFTDLFENKGKVLKEKFKNLDDNSKVVIVRQLKFFMFSLEIAEPNFCFVDEEKWLEIIENLLNYDLRFLINIISYKLKFVNLDFLYENERWLKEKKILFKEISVLHNMKTEESENYSSKDFKIKKKWNELIEELLKYELKIKELFQKNKFTTYLFENDKLKYFLGFFFYCRNDKPARYLKELFFFNQELDLDRCKIEEFILEKLLENKAEKLKLIYNQQGFIGQYIMKFKLDSFLEILRNLENKIFETLSRILFSKLNNYIDLSPDQLKSIYKESSLEIVQKLRELENNQKVKDEIDLFADDRIEKNKISYEEKESTKENNKKKKNLKKMFVSLLKKLRPKIIFKKFK